MPPDTYEDEKAPPMMAVVFHLKDFMKITVDDEKFSKFIPFVQDYVINPSRDKSYCDKESLKTYGVMPSQKGNVTKDELEAIASYMYDFYDQQKYLEQMQAKAAFDALPKGEQIARKNGCFNCHTLNKKGVGPSFSEISKRDAKEIIDTISNGSHGKWEGFHVMMPAFKIKLTQENIVTLQKWIQEEGKKEKTNKTAEIPAQTPWKVKK
jgi:cytochrome c